MAKRKRIVTVTGASGFVGRHVVERLLEEKGIEVRCLVRGPEGAAHGEGLEATIEQGDGPITKEDPRLPAGAPDLPRHLPRIPEVSIEAVLGTGGQLTADVPDVSVFVLLFRKLRQPR